METHYPTNEVVHVKFLSASNKPIMRRIYSYVTPAMYDELAEVARQEDLDMSAAIRELLAIGLRLYKFKKGTLNVEQPHNKKTFFCQSCNMENPMRQACYKTLDFDQYVICEKCMFDRAKLKGFIAKILQGV